MKFFLKHIVAFAAGFLSISATSAQHLDFTIKNGPDANQVQIFLTPDADHGPTVIQQMTLIVGWESSCAAIAPFVSWTGGPILTNPFSTSTYSELDNSGTGTIGGTSYAFAEHTWSRVSGDFATCLGGTEYLLATVTFNGGSPSCPISLLDFEDAGSTGSANVYILDHEGNYFTPQFGNNNFYAVPGISSTGGGANGVFATTVVPISLPVTLKNFAGQVTDDCKVQLNWQTASEVNSLRFSVLKSTNGSNWQTIGTVNAAGNSNASRDYTYTDINAGAGTIYYKLLQEDIDGKKSYSSIITQRIDCGTGKIIIRPTLASNEVEVLLPQGFENARVDLINMAGQLMNVSKQGNGSYRKLRIDHLQNGVYMVKVVNTDGACRFIKIIKQ